MGRKYTNPDASGYLLEAKACEKVVKELRRIEAGGDVGDELLATIDLISVTLGGMKED